MMNRELLVCFLIVGSNLRTSSGIDGNSDCSSPTTDFETRVHRLSCQVQNSGSFKAIVNDERNHQLVVGGRNRLYALDYHLRLTDKVALKPNNSHVNHCQLYGYSEDHCQNYIRVVAVRGDLLLSCGTYARQPRCQYRKRERISDLVEDLPDRVQMCSDDHRQSGTVQLPENSSALFVGLTSSKKNGIWRFHGQPDPLSTDANNYKYLRLPQFVSSYTLGPHVYFFARELTDVGNMRFYTSRVARVCQSDAGGTLLIPGKWLSFVKSRLKCVQPGQLLYEYNSLVDISFTEKDGRRHAFAVFQPPESGPSGGVVCMYGFDGRLTDDIWSVFDGPYRGEHQRYNSVNVQNRCDKPRSETDSLRYVETSKQIKQATDAPLVTKSGTRLLAIAADTINHSTFVFFVATDKGTVDKYSVMVTEIESTLRGYLERKYVPVVSHVDAFKVVPVAEAQTSPIYTLLLVQKQNAVFVGTETDVVRLPLSRCDLKYQECSECAGSQQGSPYDPYCGWCMDTQQCTAKRDCRLGSWVTKGVNVSCPFVPPHVSPVVTSVWSPYLDVQVNESVLLNCSSTGMPPPSYWWMKNGEILHEVNWPEFVIPSVQAADGGLYECLAHNKWGNTTVQTVLRVRPSLHDRAPPVNIVGRFESLVLLCSTVGYPRPVVSWRKRGLALFDDRTSGIFVSRSGSLVFTRLDIVDSGMFECEAANPAGSVSFSTYVYVTESSAKFISRIVMEGESVSLICSLCGPNCTVTWTKNGRSLEPTGNLSLVIDNIRRSDSGLYRCAWDPNSETFLVRVVAPPSISVIVPASVTVAANSSAVLDLHASGEPPPSVRWSKGGEVLVTGSRVLVTETLSLVITNLQLSDAGIYVARVYNPIGFQEVVFSVSVYEKQECPPLVNSVTEGGSIVFTCQYTSIFLQSDQFLPVAWIGPQLPRSAHSIASSRDGLTYVGTLNISDVGTAEEGEYSCTVNADQGLSRCRWWLTVTSSSLASPGALCSTPSGEIKMGVAVFVSVIIGGLLFGLLAGGFAVCFWKGSRGNSKTVHLRNGAPPRRGRMELHSISSMTSTVPLTLSRTLSVTPTESPSPPKSPKCA